MTSKLTRERVFALIAEHSYDSALVDALEHLLAAMDSEPVAYIFKHPAGRLFWALTDESNKCQSDVMPVYAEPQPAPAFPDFDNVLESLDYEVRCNAWESEHVMQACQTTYDACRAAMLAADPQLPGSEPATVPGKWIPVRERMPEKGQAVLVYRPKAHEGGDSDVRVAVYGRHNFEHGFGCYWEPSHWMPLPAAPQEVGDA